MQTRQIANQAVTFHSYNTVVVGSGAAGMNCAVHLCELMERKGIAKPAERIAVVTGGLGLGASRMSGSDKQTYYKIGTSPDVADSAEEFAKSLTAAGCCHGDLSLAEAIGSLREFYHLVQTGVPFPTDSMGTFIGYKTDHDPFERATSAGPKTSRFMSECLQKQLARYGVKIHDGQEAVHLLTVGSGKAKRIAGVVTVDKNSMDKSSLAVNVFLAANIVLAAGGPGELYKTSVYPRGQVGIHGLAFKAGLIGANLTESQFGLASTKFRWNVSGTYMQAIPRLFSTDPDGSGSEREFLTDYFDDMASMATSIFLKGYQWPFDAQRIAGHQSSLVDMAVHQETVVRGRRVWMDFRRNPVGKAGWEDFRIDRLGREARDYLEKTGAGQSLPIGRLEHMNAPAIEIYAENGIDLKAEPLEIALCAQHMNGGFAVDKWWQSNIPQTFVIGEMAGTHGVKRPGGAALNAGQTGAMRAAEYIANACPSYAPKLATVRGVLKAGLESAQKRLAEMLARGRAATATAGEAMAEIGERMTRFGAHLRSRRGAAEALADAKRQLAQVRREGLKVASAKDLPAAVRAQQQCLTHLAMLKAICAMLDRGAGSRGSHCILDEAGVQMHPALIDPASGQPYRVKAENEDLRKSILHLRYNEAAADLFDAWDVPVRPIPDRQVAFEPAWAQYRQGQIYDP